MTAMTAMTASTATPRPATAAHAALLLGLGWCLLAAPAPAGAQAPAFEEIALVPGPADLIEAGAGRAYVAAERTLTVYDLSDPSAPRRGGSYTFPEKIWGFVVRGELVYVAADFFGLGIVDVSDADAPRLLGSVKTPGQVKDVDVSGDRAVLADHMSGVDLVDISDLRAPLALGSVYLDGYSRDVATAGPLAYAVDDPSGFYVLDLADTDSWEPAVALQSADGPRMVEVTDTAAGGLAVLLGHGALQVYDLATPTEPVHRSTYATPGGALRVALDGPLAYVADGLEGVLVVDLTAPDAPRVAGSHRPAQPVRDVAVSGDLVLLAVGPLPTGIRRSVGGGEVLVLRRRATPSP